MSCACGRTYGILRPSAERRGATMLRTLKLTNFRTCVATEVSFEPVTLLIGKNNSGKTNICQALEFMGAAAEADSLDNAARMLGLPPLEVVTRYLPGEPVTMQIEASAPCGDEELEYRYELVISCTDLGPSPGHVLNVVSEHLSATVDGDEWRLMEREGAEVRLLHETRPQAGVREPRVETTAPPRQAMIARLLDLPDNPRANAFRQYLRSWRYYTISAEIMRTSRRADWDTFLADDASNIASVLFTLKSEDTRAFNRLVSLVKEIEPSIETLNFIRPRPEEVYMEVEDTEGNRYNPESLSDGTLNYLALCYVALQGSLRTARDTVPPALVAYEEPERGLYVGHLRRFMEVLQEAGKTQQVILTTHNPYLIDLFEDHREQVRLVSRGEHSLRDGTTVAAPDADKLDGLLESFSLGELYYRELLQ